MNREYKFEMPYLNMILMLIVAFSCKENKKSTVPAETVTNPYLEAIENSSTASNPVDSLHTAKFVLDQDSIDFGTITEGDTVKYTLYFRNTGNKKGLISHVESSCGCTVAKHPKGFIEPGKKDSILVEYHSKGKSGLQSKDILIFANTYPQVTRFKVKTFVKPRQ
ncbi:MAG TPA: DUF1573 domain-containing protein [Saprospiraceae bacterium]|nr:DUF1573 domain-containing protein [Saprospiraceae bacterium]